jgi:hypothetical protein
VSTRSSIIIPDRTSHALVRYPDLVELGPLGPETQLLVKSAGVSLGIQVHLGETALAREIHEFAHDGETGPAAAVLRQYGDATNLTGGLQTARANQVTFCLPGGRPRQDMRYDGVEVVPFLVLGDALFLYENSPAHPFDRRTVMLPRGKLDVELRRGRWRHFGDAGLVMSRRKGAYVNKPVRCQTSRASFAARPR